MRSLTLSSESAFHFSYLTWRAESDTLPRSIYFSIIGTQLLKRFVKRVQRRLDFSIDIFSPKLDIEKHISRRVWQETISTLYVPCSNCELLEIDNLIPRRFFTSPEFAMKPDTKLVYTKDSELAPYLLHFQGSTAERHAENLKVRSFILISSFQELIFLSILDTS